MNYWALIAIDTGRQYGGNDGYKDDPSSHYSYDSRVPNHKKVAAGDVVFLRNASQVLGVAQVESVDEESGTKLERRCPSCGAVNVRERKSMTPRWRCSKCRAEFDEPIQNQVEVRAFTAHFGTSFRPAPDQLDARVLKGAAVAPNDQLAIERLDPIKIAAVLAGKFPEADRFLEVAAVSQTLAPGDAELPPDSVSYVPWEGDERQSALRAIRVRRGQQSFRKRLIEIYQSRCVISGCKLLDILEAAHISPYRGALDNLPDNGLLLRSDLHTLFDLGHLAIDPDTLTARFSPVATEDGYGHMNGAKLETEFPSRAALRLRWDVFVARHLADADDQLPPTLGGKID